MSAARVVTGGTLGDILLSDVSCTCVRDYGRAGPPWLLSIRLPMFAYGRQWENLALQCRAVVDDFGDLVPVWEWQ